MKLRNFQAQVAMAPEGADGGSAGAETPSTGTTEQGAGGPTSESESRLDDLQHWMSFDPIRTPNPDLKPVLGDEGTGTQAEPDTGAATPPTAAAPTPAAPASPAAPPEPPKPEAPLTQEQLNAAMAGMLYGTSAPSPSPAPAPPQAAPAAPSAQPAAEAPYQAFQPEQMAIPPQIEQAIFDADTDPAIRSQALRALLAVHASVAVNAAIERMQTHVLPTQFQQWSTAQAAQAEATAAKEAFYKDFPELAAQGDLVKRAVQVVADQDRVAGRVTKLDKDTLARVGQLAKYALSLIPGAAPQPAPPSIPPSTLAAGNGYLAGGARPEGHGGQGTGAVNPHVQEMMDLMG